MKTEDSIQRIAKDGVKFINFQFTTIDGAIRQMIHPAGFTPWSTEH